VEVPKKVIGTLCFIFFSSLSCATYTYKAAWVTSYPGITPFLSLVWIQIYIFTSLRMQDWRRAGGIAGEVGGRVYIFGMSQIGLG
jgi:hypothetical protein